MHNISRRNFVLSATAASAAFGLNGPLEFIGSAQAQSYANAKLIDKGFHKFKVGNVEVTQIYDGIWNRAFEDNFVKTRRPIRSRERSRRRASRITSYRSRSRSRS